MGILRPVTLAFVLAAASALCLASCAGDAGDAEQLSSSESLFRRHCAVCHGRGGDGGQVGALKVPNLKDRHARTLTDDEITRQIFDGGKGMPPFKYTLTDEQIQELVRFVRHQLQSSAP